MSMRWPEMMLKRDAAEYFSLSLAAFEREVFAGRLPMPGKFGGHDHWRRSVIDRAPYLITGDLMATGPDAPYRQKTGERHLRHYA